MDHRTSRYPTDSGQATLHTSADTDAGVELRVSGSIDAAVGRTIGALTSDLGPSTQLNIDLTAVSSMNAAGFAAIAVAVRIGDADHVPTITCAPGPIRHLLDITLLDQEAIVLEVGDSSSEDGQRPFERAFALIQRRRRTRSKQSRD